MKIPYWPLLLGPTILYYLGGLFNLGVMALNHGQMPVQIPPDFIANADFDARHCLMTSATHLKFFCDWLQLGDGVASVGDLLIWFGDKYDGVSLAIWAALVIKDLSEFRKQYPQ